LIKFQLRVQLCRERVESESRKSEVESKYEYHLAVLEYESEYGVAVLGLVIEYRRAVLVLELDFRLPGLGLDRLVLGKAELIIEILSFIKGRI